jgi:hypothetical protein
MATFDKGSTGKGMDVLAAVPNDSLSPALLHYPSYILNLDIDAMGLGLNQFPVGMTNAPALGVQIPVDFDFHLDTSSTPSRVK